MKDSRYADNGSFKVGASRAVFLFIFIDFLVSYYMGTMVHQLHSPVLRFPYVDLTYWFLHLLKIPDFIAESFYVALIFDLALFTLPIIILCHPQRRVLYFIFFILFGLYYFIYSSYGGYHVHYKTGILVISAAFLFREKHFSIAWEAVRYYTAFIFFDAFIWKLFRGTLFHPGQGNLIVKKNFINLLFFHPSHGLSQFYQFLLQSPILLDLLVTTGTLLEATFIIAFFTKKLDKWFVFTILILPIGFLLLAEAYFFEFWILALPFLPRALFGKIQFSLKALTKNTTFLTF